MGTKLLSKAFSIIELVKVNKEMKLSEITRELKLHKSTAHRIIHELCDYDYLEKIRETKKYRLGLKFINIFGYIIKNLDIREIANDGLEVLRKESNETVHLALLTDEKAIYIEKKETEHLIRMYSQIGKIAPLYCTGVGKAILAFQPKEMISNILDSIKLERFTKNTITNKKDLLKEFENIREQGFSIDREEHEENIICIAAPIKDYNKNTIGAVSITAILYKKSLNDLLEYKDILLRESNNISKKLGYCEI